MASRHTGDGVERAYDRGRVVLFTSTVDRDWGRIADSGRTFLPLVHGWMRTLGNRERASAWQ